MGKWTVEEWEALRASDVVEETVEETKAAVFGIFFGSYKVDSFELAAVAS